SLFSLIFFYLYSYLHILSLHSFPTRRSSDLFNQNFLTFNSLNIFILKGDGAQGMELTFASLMARAFDEPDALYGLAARAVRISADRKSTRLNSSHVSISYAVFCLKKKK